MTKSEIRTGISNWLRTNAPTVVKARLQPKDIDKLVFHLLYAKGMSKGDLEMNELHIEEPK